MAKKFSGFFFYMWCDVMNSGESRLKHKFQYVNIKNINKILKWIQLPYPMNEPSMQSHGVHKLQIILLKRERETEKTSLLCFNRTSYINFVNQIIHHKLTILSYYSSSSSYYYL